jgi:hypothetical protein
MDFSPLQAADFLVMHYIYFPSLLFYSQIPNLVYREPVKISSKKENIPAGFSSSLLYIIILFILDLFILDLQEEERT